MSEFEQIKEMVLACDSNLRISKYFDDTLLWYSKFYFGEIDINKEKVGFWRIYFDEITKRAYKTPHTEIPFSEITPDFVKDQVNGYIESLEFTNKRMKEMEVMKRISDADTDFT